MSKRRKRRRNKTPFHRGLGSKSEELLSKQMHEYSIKHEPQKPFQLRVVLADGPDYKIVFVDFLVQGGLIVEVDGSHHRREKWSAKDSSRDARLVAQGKCKEVMRIRNGDVYNGVAMRRILQWLGRPDAHLAQAECDCRRVPSQVTTDTFFVE